MLVNFTVSNYKSIKDEVTLNLTAHKRSKKEGTIQIEKYDISVLPLTALYGANGSGKSNLINALYFMDCKVRGEKEQEAIPFLFGTASDKQAPSSFSVLFIADDGVMYHYGFSILRNSIEAEWLLAYYSNYRPTMLFERYKENGEIIFSFGASLKKQTKNGARFLTFISQDMDKERLFLYEAALRNIAPAKIVRDWFIKNLLIIPSRAHRKTLSQRFFHDNERLMEISNDMRSFDFDFDSFRIDEESIPVDKQNESFSKMNTGEIYAGVGEKKYSALTKKENGEIYELRLSYLHRDSNGNTVSMPIDSASGGFKRLLEFFSDFDFKSNLSRTVIIDEIEASLHPLLLEKFINEVLKYNLDISSGQLIFATHDTNILNFPFIRNDEIQFVEKDEMWSTHLTGLAEFKDINSDLNIEKGYLKGRFGAIPLVSFDIRRR